jgi:hypothetical protein
MLNPNYIMRKVIVDKSVISNGLFVINDEERRNIRGGSVKKLISLLDSQKHFSSPFVTNETTSTGRQNLVDGNHRYEAIKDVIARNPNFSITVWVAVYRDLTDAEEKQVYKDWNVGVPQSATDFLKANFKSIPYGQEMLRRLPVSIYGAPNKIAIKNLVGSHVNARKQRNFEGGYSGGKEQTIADFQNITPDDITVIAKFCKFMENVFGRYDKKNNYKFYGTTPLGAFYRIWYDNYQDIPENRLENAFKKTFASRPEIWAEQISAGGRVPTKILYELSITTLNRVHKTLHIKSDREILEKRKLQDKDKDKIVDIINKVKGINAVKVIETVE